MEKKPLTAEQIYKRRQKTAKLCGTAAPFVFWICIALCILCFAFAVRHSIGNILEMKELLNSRKHTGEELAQNYEMLVQKYGEWEIGQMGGGFSIRFVDVGKAMINGLAVVNAVLCVFFLLSAYILGKWLLPRLSNQITQDNQDMVNLRVLEMTRKNK